MFTITFPKYTGQRYWNIHYAYVLSILTYLGCEITMDDRPCFVVTINGKDFLIDYSDSSEVASSDLPIFKFHCHEETDQVKAFPPASFLDWDQYYELEKMIEYEPPSKIAFISARQRVYGNATERRKAVRKMLMSRHGHLLLTRKVDQRDYWMDIHRCISMAVFVPGYCNNMLDRAQLQYMAFGCCTMSPRLPELLTKTQLTEDVHYVQCKDDYSDVVELLEENDRKKWQHIGHLAKQRFLATCTPEAIGKLIEERLGEV